MKLIVQPADGAAPLLKAIKQAKKSIEIVIFRFDQSEIEHALEDAAQRGVFVHALIAFTNRGGEKHLRQLEMRFLEKGITVARTADDLVRYHGKMMLVDSKDLYAAATRRIKSSCSPLLSAPIVNASSTPSDSA